ncbi:unnamed protein product, partial [Ectocarpus sp. 12 AP-2014]
LSRLRRQSKTSEKYNPARLLSVIPSHFLEEHALLLSRLGRHEEVLHIYVRQVCAKPSLAKRAQGTCGPTYAATATPSPDEEVYLCLLKVYLQSQNKAGGHHPAQRKAGSASSLKASDDGVAAVGDEVGGLDEAVSLLERHFSRVDPVKVMALLPPSVPVAKFVPFLSSAVRHAEARRRSNQVRVTCLVS